MKDYELLSPAVSVVMSVYNGEDHLAESIESILNQTFRNFEFIIVNDGSNDSTMDILNAYAKKDPRIRLITQKNSGLAKALNRGIRLSRADLIARQDADDVSLPERLEKQLQLFDSVRNLVLCGTWFEEVDEGGGKKLRAYPCDNTTLKDNVLYANNFCHPSVMFKKGVFMACNGYDESFLTAQDFDLWIRLSCFGSLANVSEKLVIKRIGFGSTVSWKKRRDKLLVVSKIVKKHFIHRKSIDWIKFIKFYFPLAAYGYIPEFILRQVRRIRYK